MESQCVYLAVFETAAQRPRYTTGSGCSHVLQWRLHTIDPAVS